MKPTNGRHGHEMDQFQANLRALQTAAPTDPEGQPAEALPGGSGTPVPYPDNPIWAAALRGWAPQPPTAPPGEAAPPPEEPAAGAPLPSVPDTHNAPSSENDPPGHAPQQDDGEEGAPTAPAAERVDSCHGLQAGTAIEARGPRGVVAFEGTVEDTAPAHGLFWAVSPQGHRKIIDLDEYEVYIR